ncbi:MAG: porphobilinogen synthase, partial [Deltaproteobacteria bacterium]|nr:porphobilinogen synthase [Deltaproteobacteria bacterium]
MNFPQLRLRRLRRNERMRRLVRETSLSVDDLVYPLFVRPGKGVKIPISAMVGHFQLSIDQIIQEVDEVERLRIPGAILFGIPEKKDEVGSEAYSDDGIVQRAIRAIKEEFPDFLIITDVCLCEYTSHGHCGVVEGDQILNDPTLELLAKQALSHARAGADMVAPSDMMDGRVRYIRQTLEQNSFHDTAIMSYAAKFASAFYG